MPQPMRHIRAVRGFADPVNRRRACSDPPDGRGSWTLQLLADRLVVLGQVESVSRETVRKALKKKTFNSES